ncbi:T9SS type B sorting domain-containing protein [Maribacter confluentis]|uniref:T9SS type B sorting domain-containing protein n=1 Tax=Maribacter confluentis TaxID=1656093 RepID=A0ABT8RNR9_9FLAO|nr:T9SS type B sorting domain-containing protein [Maribacter confluentis]MDO1512543.1 T9SS type B sorting domain-containing protein [Maribacter confluentis]
MKTKCPKIFFSFITLLCLSNTVLQAQLGFCGGSSGDPIFTEDFGSGTTDGPALPAGTTSYNFTTGTPNDGDYTISSTTNYFDWISVQDHTPGDTNGKSFIVNASFTAGEFYQRQVMGLCENTTYEFSSWLINLQSIGSCEGNSIPVNVRFQIWDETDTNLLAQGDTGSITANSNTEWQQYALVFTTEPGQTSVILKMRNNSNGGCGNDLAIDDIVFKSCGDNVTVSTNSAEESLTICEDQGSVTSTIIATPDNSIFSTHAYQWQQSNDQQLWSDIPNETSNTLSTPPITETTYYRVKIAEDPINVNNDLCNIVSNVFDIIVQTIPNAPISNGNVTICQGETGILTATTVNSYTVNWYDQPTGGSLLLEDSINFETELAGTYYAEAVSTTITCSSTSRTAISLTVNQPPNVQDETVTFCEGTMAILTANMDNANYEWNTGATTQEITTDTPGIYTVLITDSNGCSATKTITAEQIDLPIISTIRSNGPSIEINIENEGEFEYSLDGFNYQNSPVFEAANGGNYTVYVRDTFNCGVVTQNFDHLVIPSFFTPNGDNVNDVFELEGTNAFPNLTISIFDRYGKLLKFANSDAAYWDGTFQGKQMPSDDYWYKIIARSKQIDGHFTLKR